MHLLWGKSHMSWVLPQGECLAGIPRRWPHRLECSNPHLIFWRQRLAYDCSIPKFPNICKCVSWEFWTSLFSLLTEPKFTYLKTTRVWSVSPVLEWHTQSNYNDYPEVNFFSDVDNSSEKIATTMKEEEKGMGESRGSGNSFWDVIEKKTPRMKWPFSSVQSLSCVWLFATPWFTAHQTSLSITNSRSLLKLISIETVMPSSHPILLLLLPPIPPSIRVFSTESTLRMRWPKFWSFSFSISPSNEHPGLVSFRMDGLDLLAVQGTLKSLLQHHSSKASIFQHSAFLTVQLLHPYMTTGKTIALTRWTFVGKVISLLFNMLSRLVITLHNFPSKE